MQLATSGEVSHVLGGTEEKNELGGVRGMGDPLVLPAKYLCPRSGVSLGDLALPGVERKRGCEKSEGGDRKVKDEA